MSYLAMSAAPIDNQDNQQYNNENTINKKRQTHHSSHTKTQKFRQPSSDFNPQKVNSVLQSIHNNTIDDEELGNYSPNGTPVTSKHSDNFKPINPYEFPPKPMSMGGERTKQVEGMTNIDDSLVPKPTDNEELNLKELQSNFMNDAQVRDYYRKLIPNYNHSQFNKSENMMMMMDEQEKLYLHQQMLEREYLKASTASVLAKGKQPPAINGKVPLIEESKIPPQNGLIGEMIQNPAGLPLGLAEIDDELGEEILAGGN
jgi:hypothetical protein